MRKCPDCKKYTLDLDNYFGRFRCFNPSCSWMAASSTEMELNRIEASEERSLLCENPIHGTELTLRAVYYPINDALAFDFGQGKPSFDLPDPDGIMTWKVGRDSNTVVGFAIVGVTKFDISHLTVNLQLRKECIDENIKSLREEIGSGRARRVLIEKVAVAATKPVTEKDGLDEAVSKTLGRVREECKQS